MNRLSHLIEIVLLLIVLYRQKTLNQNQDIIMAKQDEAAQSVRDLTAQINKIGTETATTLQKVTDLEAIIAAGGDVSPELQAALDEAKAAAQRADDLTPDAPVVEPPTV